MYPLADPTEADGLSPTQTADVFLAVTTERHRLRRPQEDNTVCHCGQAASNNFPGLCDAWLARASDAIERMMRPPSGRTPQDTGEEADPDLPF